MSSQLGVTVSTSPHCILTSLDDIRTLLPLVCLGNSLYHLNTIVVEPSSLLWWQCRVPNIHCHTKGLTTHRPNKHDTWSAQTHTHTQTHTLTHAHTYTHTQMHTHTRTHINTQMHALTLTHTCLHCMCTHTHAHTHTQTHTHIHTQKHTCFTWMHHHIINKHSTRNLLAILLLPATKPF